MFGRPSHVPAVLTSAQAARLLHSRWLTEALASPRPLPSVPVVPVDEGGFSLVTGTPLGRAWVEAWWTRILDQVHANLEPAGSS
jgi:hypothetical protein